MEMHPITPSAELALTKEFPPIHYTGFKALKKTVDALRDNLCSNGNDGNQYVPFDHVSPEVFEKIEEKRLYLIMKARLSYFPDIQTLIVKIPSEPQERAHGTLGQLIQLRTITPMNLDLSELMFLGASTKKSQSRSSKESDSAWKNVNIRSREDDFPCLVVEAGLSEESLSRLRRAASWWIESSAGKVNIFLIIWICKAKKMLHIEKYIPGQGGYADLAATIVINCADSPTTVTGAPLVLEFDRVFDRAPDPPLERDVVFTMQDLQRWGDQLWIGIWAEYLEGLKSFYKADTYAHKVWK